MIRHTSVGVPKGTCYGWSDVPVADTFEAEAAETKRNLVLVAADKGAQAGRLLRMGRPDS